METPPCEVRPRKEASAGAQPEPGPLPSRWPGWLMSPQEKPDWSWPCAQTSRRPQAQTGSRLALSSPQCRALGGAADGPAALTQGLHGETPRAFPGLGTRRGRRKPPLRPVGDGGSLSRSAPLRCGSASWPRGELRPLPENGRFFSERGRGAASLRKCGNFLRVPPGSKAFKRDLSYIVECWKIPSSPPHGVFLGDRTIAGQVPGGCASQCGHGPNALRLVLTGSGPWGPLSLRVPTLSEGRMPVRPAGVRGQKVRGRETAQDPERPGAPGETNRPSGPLLARPPTPAAPTSAKVTRAHRLWGLAPARLALP